MKINIINNKIEISTTGKYLINGVFHNTENKALKQLRKNNQVKAIIAGLQTVKSEADNKVKAERHAIYMRDVFLPQKQKESKVLSKKEIIAENLRRIERERRAEADIERKKQNKESEILKGIENRRKNPVYWTAKKAPILEAYFVEEWNYETVHVHVSARYYDEGESSVGQRRTTPKKYGVIQVVPLVHERELKRIVRKNSDYFNDLRAKVTVSRYSNTKPLGMPNASAFDFRIESKSKFGNFEHELIRQETSIDTYYNMVELCIHKLK